MTDLSELILKVKKELEYNGDVNKNISDDMLMDIIKKTIQGLSSESYISLSEKSRLIRLVYNSMRGLDILQPLVDDNSIDEIMINGSKSIFIEQNGHVTKTNLSFENGKLENIIQNIVSRVNRTVNEACPIVDARLQNGSRVNIILPPVSLNGPTVTIRKFPSNPIDMDQLIRLNSITKEAAMFLKNLVAAKYNIFISGGTSSGKTTFLNVLSNFIPEDERVITIEDAAELQIKNIKNLVRLETRNTNVEGKGLITIRDLIKTSLRLRPERIIVGEVRGAEALDMLQAMNTGHDGSLSCGHANSAKDMLYRIETMVLMSSAIPLDAVRRQIASAIDIIVHLGKLKDKRRTVLEISEVGSYSDGNIMLNPIYVYQDDTLKRTSANLINTHKLDFYLKT